MSKQVVEVVGRFWVLAFICALFPFGAVAVVGGAISLNFLAVIAFVVSVGFNFAQWLGHRILFGGTPEYEQLRAKGKDAWFDVSCPWPFRPDTDQHPLVDAEPEIQWFCRSCGEEAFDLDAPCSADRKSVG